MLLGNSFLMDKMDVKQDQAQEFLVGESAMHCTHVYC